MTIHEPATRSIRTAERPGTVRPRVLEVDGLTRTFGAVRAVDGISFEVREGEILSIIGPNGSGKTTTINLLSGLIPHERGTIVLNGQRIDGLSAERRSELGIARTFQNGRVFANMTVADNVYVGLYAKLTDSRPWPRLRHVPLLRWASLLGELALALVQPPSVKREQARERAQIDIQLARFGDRLSNRGDHPAYSLSYANRRRTEIARALAGHPRLLLLDEPTAGMNQTETAEVLGQLRELKAQGHTLVLVEHKIDLVMTLSDRVIVMDNGKVIAQGPPAEIRNDEQVIEAYLGRRRQRDPLRTEAVSSEPAITPLPQLTKTDRVLELRSVDVFYGAAHALHEVSLYVAPGEIVSLLGGNASGKSTTMKTVLGLVKPKRGQVLLDGRPADALSTADRVRGGVASVPEARRVFPNMTIEENLHTGAFTRSNRREIKQDLERLYESFPRLAERRTQAAGTLSGGEQQMLAFARALMSRPRLICMDEPTMGLSPVFVERVLDMIVDINARLGVAVLMVEQNAELALSIASRGYVLQTGSIVLEGPAHALLGDDLIREAYLGKVQRDEPRHP
jgi:ABC-type branched-subunit amino acid transport system ATPase component